MEEKKEDSNLQEFAQVLQEDLNKHGFVDKDGDVAIKGIGGDVKIAKEIKPGEKQYSVDELKFMIKDTFEKVKYVLKSYIKLKEDYYDVVAIWIMGTYCMKNFETYPYLFINAQKGSGKTRLLKLIEQLAHKGELLASMREAVLFRIATTDRTILIDELEGLDRKENAPLKELLNSCYKRGTKVYRMKKVKDEYIPEAFFPFTPIAIANITGTDDVLGDRCITIRLDKSSKSSFSLLQEDFSKSPLIKNIQASFKQISVYMCRLCSQKHTLKSWNLFINILYPNTTLTTLTTQNTSLTKENNIEPDVVSVYNKIIESGISGRHLELVFPLFRVALILGEDVFDKVLKFSKTMTEKKKDDDIMESTDVSLIDFVAKMKTELNYDKFRYVHEINKDFRYFMGIRNDREQEEINSIWVGRALKRLGLVVEKKRMSGGMEVRLNIIKAEKMLENLK